MKFKSRGKRKTSASLKTSLQPASEVMGELSSLETCVGEFMHYWGFKKVHGRIWTHLYTSVKPLDSLTLMEKLDLSKGLISIAIRELLQHEVILLDHVGAHGVSYYRANPDFMSVISKVLRDRERLMLQKTKVHAEKLLKISPKQLDQEGLSRERCQEVLALTESAQNFLELFLLESASPKSHLFDQLGCLNLKESQMNTDS